MQLGRTGVFFGTDGMSAADAASFARRVESLRYGTLWISESSGRNALVHAAWLLASTSRLNIGTGIANIYGRDPVAMAAAQATLAEQSGGRFILGIGVSHPPLVEGLRGHVYDRKPVAAMRAYLAGMKGFTYAAPAPAEKPRTLLAALGPKMVDLAGEAADGVIPFNITPEHTALARTALGPGKLICTEQKVLLTRDAATARGQGRALLVPYLKLDNYLNNWRRLGFADDDFMGGGSDRLIDALFAWGEEKQIRARIQAHLDAGADHVFIHAALQDGAGRKVDEEALRLLAPG